MNLPDEALTKAADPVFRRDILAGFSRSPKTASARWFYDRRGSELFEAITKLPEYYLTRVETALLDAYSEEIGAVAGSRRAVIEFGAGSAAKTPHLLRRIDPAAYLAVDISGDFLRESTAALQQAFPAFPVRAMEGDFTHPMSLPRDLENKAKLGFFPGSTIGNFGPEAAVDLLRSFGDTLGEGALLLIGVDRIKDLSVLLPAYEDPGGVTAAFNLNLLERINRELAGSIPVEAFRHAVRWNDGAARIEMHLEAVRDLRFTVSGRAFTMQAGETIHTENSHKYGLRDARFLLRAGGWTPLGEWTDAGEGFSLFLARA